MFSEPEGWEEAFQKLCKTISRSSSENEKFHPKIVNVVTTVSLLPAGYRLPLHDIARRFSNAQFAPNCFAAVRLTLRDNLSQTTALLFSPGALVVVGSRTPCHALYWSRVVAVMISSTRFPIYNKETNQIEMHTLSSYMQFDSFRTHNYVGHGDLGHTLNLNDIHKQYSITTSHFVGLFPGLTCHVWLTKDYKCHCKTGNKKCKCKLRVLLFETGQVVLPGCKSIEDMNKVFYRVRQAVAKMHATEMPAVTPFFHQPDQRKRPRRDFEFDPYKPQGLGIYRKSNLSPMIRFALDDRLEEVAYMLSLQLDPPPHDALERLSLVHPPDRMPNYETILQLLKDACGSKTGME